MKNDQYDLSYHASIIWNLVSVALSDLGWSASDVANGLHVVFGDPVWDDCCGKAATISMGTIGPSRYDRSPAAAGCTRFDVPWSVDLVDCVEYRDDGSLSNSSVEKAVAASQAALDAILCAAVAAPGVWVVSAGTVGPQGGCISTRVQLRTLYEVC